VPTLTHTPQRYCQCLTYVGLGTFDTLHKKPCRIGPGLCSILQVDFRENLFYEVLNKGKNKEKERNQGMVAPGPQFSPVG
jgi:hypothetical protein